MICALTPTPKASTASKTVKLIHTKRFRCCILTIPLLSFAREQQNYRVVNRKLRATAVVPTMQSFSQNYNVGLFVYALLTSSLSIIYVYCDLFAPNFPAWFTTKLGTGYENVYFIAREMLDNLVVSTHSARTMHSPEKSCSSRFGRRLLLQSAAAITTLPAISALAQQQRESSLPANFENLRPLGARVKPIVSDEYQARIARVQRLLAEQKPSIDALFVA